MNGDTAPAQPNAEVPVEEVAPTEQCGSVSLFVAEGVGPAYVYDSTRIQSRVVRRHRDSGTDLKTERNADCINPNGYVRIANH
jgi:hypothetical protein